MSLHSRVMLRSLQKHFRHNYWRIHLGLTMLATMCFQFSMLNIYHPFRYHHLKGRAVMWWSHYACDYWDLVFCTNFHHLLLPRAWREDTATTTEKLRNSQPIKLTIIAPSTRLQKECTSSQKPVHRGLTTPYFPTHHTARAAESAEKSALANNCPMPPPNRTNRKHTSNCIGYKSEWD